MEEFLADIKSELPSEQAAEVYATLAKVLGNILRSPCEAKFRTLRKDNRLVADSICTSLAAVSLLLLLGFEDQIDAYHCPMTTDLEQMTEASELLRNMTMNLELLASQPEPAKAVATQPADAKAAAPLRRAPRVSEEDKGRLQQEQQLHSLRASRRERDRRTAVVPADQTQLAAPRPPQEPLDLLGAPPASAASHESTAGAGACGADEDSYVVHDDGDSPPMQCQAAAPGTASPGSMLFGSDAGEKPSRRQPPSRTLFDFQRRDGSRNFSEDQQLALDELKRVQRERYRQFQSDPRGRDAEAYARPPTGLFDGKSKSSTAPSTPGEWLSQESKRLSDSLKGTSERWSSELSGVSTRLSSGLNELAGQWATAGWGNWQLSRPGEADEPCQVSSLPGRFRVVGKAGALVRQGVEKDTPTVDILRCGTEFVGVESGRCSTGEHRLRLEAPLRGWLTLKAGGVERVLEEDSAEFG